VSIKYKGEDVVQGAMGGFSLDGKFIYGNLAITPTAMVYYDKKVEDVCPLANIAKVELVKGGPVFAVTLNTGGEKQYRTGNAKGWVSKLEEWVQRAAQAPAAPVAPLAQPAYPSPQAAAIALAGGDPHAR
jgi:hypothetical protein